LSAPVIDSPGSFSPNAHALARLFELYDRKIYQPAADCNTKIYERKI
jgi:hypothetical protein